jgi:hypothetical protein
MYNVIRQGCAEKERTNPDKKADGFIFSHPSAFLANSAKISTLSERSVLVPMYPAPD